jgi:hypothetical protein
MGHASYGITEGWFGQYLDLKFNKNTISGMPKENIPYGEIELP